VIHSGGNVKADVRAMELSRGGEVRALSTLAEGSQYWANYLRH